MHTVIAFFTLVLYSSSWVTGEELESLGEEGEDDGRLVRWDLGSDDDDDDDGKVAFYMQPGNPSGKRFVQAVWLVTTLLDMSSNMVDNKYTQDQLDEADELMDRLEVLLDKWEERRKE